MGLVQASGGLQSTTTDNVTIDIANAAFIQVQKMAKWLSFSQPIYDSHSHFVVSPRHFGIPDRLVDLIATL